MAISLYDYKIDYNQFLGSGCHCSVYRLVVRPEREKGWLSYLFPTVYDYFRRPQTAERQNSDFCAKVIHPSLDLFYESATERTNALATNRLLRDHQLTELTVLSSTSPIVYCQTFVNGARLSEIADNTDCFYNPRYFPLRKDYIRFLRDLGRQNLLIYDLHRGNIMFDTEKNHWEIIDGTAVASDEKPVIPRFGSYDIISRTAMDHLTALAETEKNYAPKDDQELLAILQNSFSKEEFTYQRQIKDISLISGHDSDSAARNSRKVSTAKAAKPPH